MKVLDGALRLGLSAGSHRLADPRPAAVPRAERRCGRQTDAEVPYCAEFVLAEARVCKHCGRDVEPRVTTQPPQPTEGNKVCPGCVQIIDKMDAIERFEGQRWHHACAQRKRRSR